MITKKVKIFIGIAAIIAVVLAGGILLVNIADYSRQAVTMGTVKKNVVKPKKNVRVKKDNTPSVTAPPYIR